MICVWNIKGEHCDKCERGYVKKINDTTGEQFCSLKGMCVVINDNNNNRDCDYCNGHFFLFIVLWPILII